MRRLKRHLEDETTAWLEEIAKKLETSDNPLLTNVPISTDAILKIAKKGSRLFLTEFQRLTPTSAGRSKKMLLLLNQYSDKLYALLITAAKKKVDRILLLRLMDTLESLRHKCKDHDGKIYASMPLTSLDRSIRVPLLRQQLGMLQESLDSSQTDQQLRLILYQEIESITRDRQLSGSRLENLSIMIGQILKTPSPDTDQVARLLLEHNFNSLRIFSYWTEHCIALLTDEGSTYQQVETILRWESELVSLPRRAEHDGPFHGQSLQKMAARLYRNLKTLYLQKLDLRTSKRAAAAQEDYQQVSINLSVAQLGLLIRLFMENGILPKHDVGKTFAHYARIYRTERTPHISADSLQKKSTDVEYATVKKIKSHLIAMVNWLNKHYGHNIQ